MTSETHIQQMFQTVIENLIDAREEVESEDCDIATLADIVIDLVDETQSIARVASFDETGLLTRDEGLVLRMDDGSEFQISIVQSKVGRDDDDRDEDEDDDSDAE